MTEYPIYLGQTPLQVDTQPSSGAYVQLLGETYYRIAHVDQMPTFFMSLVSASDHWLFIASNGGLTAGRRTADVALFPYETEDKIAAHHEGTGGKTLVRARRNERSHLWEPFSEHYAGLYKCERHLYKNIPGDKLVFEEINHDLNLTLRTAWRTGDRFGFIRTCWLQNDGDAVCHIELLDGLQNLLPAGATVALQTTMSNLLHAYKRGECDATTGLGIFSLSATLSDRPEPSESLTATVAWQVGLENASYLLCTEQLPAFRNGRGITSESEVLGRPGAYLVNTSLSLAPGETREWHIVADVEQDSVAVVRLEQLLAQEDADVVAQIEADINQSMADLMRTIAAADGLQRAASRTSTTHHLANVLFNVMRGGIFADGLRLERRDLLSFIQVRNKVVLERQTEWFDVLPEQLTIKDLYERAAATDDVDLVRLCYEYLPLTYSRRHGDPSRPWNQFAINLKLPDGTPRLDYQGNWRDIFQNWEPLALSFPAFVEGMIAKFLNATTADGYNPYRVTRDGIEWEVPEPDNPWSNIGYWSDHQIIYLQKLLEIAEGVRPGALAELWKRPIFSYANVPYRLKPYQDMLADWYNTLDFDWESENAVHAAVARMGMDGRLQLDADGSVIHVNMMEKLLSLLLAKLTNLVPEGGIWMNTQRPEWNDANNALVGKGLSVVTVAYLRRFIAFWLSRLAGRETELYPVNTYLAQLFAQVRATLKGCQASLENGFSDQERLAIMDELGVAATQYRSAIYENGLPAEQLTLSGQVIADLLVLSLAYCEQTLRANRRADALYHAYNILQVNNLGVAVEHLYLMLEGQVAVLSSGMLAPSEAVTLLKRLRASDLYRADQDSYMLYPNRKLPNFRQKNNVPAARVAGLELVALLAANGDPRLLVQDEVGDFHFNGSFRNARDVSYTLDRLVAEPAYAAAAATEREKILALFEETFDHRSFTGRSGTFFAYEGLGSIYWHMVAKLLLAVQECYQAAARQGADLVVTKDLAAAYRDIRAGLGYNKPPSVYGAFPTDPYSHTPWGGGARQPGMTGQVKEEILTRWGELGVSLKDGSLHFAPTLLQDDEFLAEPGSFVYCDVDGDTQTISLPAQSLAFTFCQTPILYVQGEASKVEVAWRDGRVTCRSGNSLDADSTREILGRSGQVRFVRIYVR
jgi:hypothetical protein